MLFIQLSPFQLGSIMRDKKEPPLISNAHNRCNKIASTRHQPNYGITVKFVFLVTPPPAAEMVTTIFAATVLVCTVKFAELTPATTVTLAGTVATAVLPLAKMIRTPPAGLSGRAATGQTSALETSS